MKKQDKTFIKYQIIASLLFISGAVVMGSQSEGSFAISLFGLFLFGASSFASFVQGMQTNRDIIEELNEAKND